MKLFHKTQSKIENITKRGNFEDVFFFGESVHYLLEDWAFTYTVESDDLDFLKASEIQFQDNVEENALVVRFAEIFDLSLDDAIAVLSNDDDIASHTDDMSDDEKFAAATQAHRHRWPPRHWPRQWRWCVVRFQDPAPYPYRPPASSPT